MNKLILIPIIMLISCTRTIYTPITSTRTIIDTLIQNVTDSSIVNALLECDSIGNITIKELNIAKGKLANTQLELKENRVDVVTQWQTKYIDRYIVKSDTITVVEVKEVVKTVKHIPKFFWICLIITGISIFNIFRRFF